jgi:hypothetical protein
MKKMKQLEDVAQKPLDKALKFAGDVIRKPIDAGFAKLGLLAAGVSPPLTRAATNDKNKELGLVKLWVAKSTLKPKLKASPETDVEALLNGSGVRKNECLAKLYPNDFSTVANTSTHLVNKLKKQPLTASDAKDIPKLNDGVYTVELSLLDKIIECGNLRGSIDPCDLAGLTETTDKHWQNRSYLNDPSTAYDRHPAIVTNEHGERVTYQVVDQLIALVGYVRYGSGGIPSRANEPTTPARRLYTQKCILRGLGPNEEDTQYKWAFDPMNPGCYTRRPTVGYPGKPTGLILGGMGDTGQVPASYCYPPGHELDKLSTCPSTGERRGNPDCRDQVGHVLARKFGGAATADSGNIFPQAPAANRALGGPFEQLRIVDPYLLDTPPKNRVCIRIRFTFGNTIYPHRPTKLNYEWWLNRVKQTGPPEAATDNPANY